MSGNKLLRLGLPLLVAAIPLAAFFTLGLRSFYINGVWWGDDGVLASIIWHSDWMLRLPQVSGRQSFLATHMALVFWLTSGISWLLPLTRVQFFAVFLGVVQAIMALPVYVLLARLAVARPLAAGLAVLFAFNGMVIAASCNPHFELLIVAAGMAFLAALACGRVWLARLFFILCLMTREDAGFHLGLVLLTGALGLYWQGVDRAKLRILLGYAVAALCWSVVAVAVQHLYFPGGDALRRVYLGTPLFSEISFTQLAMRLVFYCLYRVYLFLPFVIGLVLAERWQMPALAAGFVSCLPWLGLNWLAVSQIAGTLSNYYPFPMVFGLFWPLSAQMFAERFGVAGFLQRRRTFFAFVAMLLASFIGLWGLQNPQEQHFPGDFFNPPSLAVQTATEQAMAAFGRAPLGHVVADGSVISLAPDLFKRAQWVMSPQHSMPDTVIFFPHGPGTRPCLQLAGRAGLERFYKVPGTALRLATNKALNLTALNLVPWVPPPDR